MKDYLEQLRQLRLENAREKEDKERQLECVNQQPEASEQVVAQFERRIAELKRQLNQREPQKIKAISRGRLGIDQLQTEMERGKEGATYYA